MSLPLKPFYFLRHGETDWNRQRFTMGSQDIPLNQTGENQAHAASHLLKKENIKHIITSPLLRAKKTAEIINKALNVNITIVNELAECSWGKQEGKSFDESILEQWLSGLTHADIEHVNDFEKRVINGLIKTFEFEAPALIVAHGGVYSAIQKIFGWPLIKIKNCSIFFHRPPEKISQPWFICPLGDDEEIYDS